MLAAVMASVMLLMTACQSGGAPRAEDEAAIRKLVGPEWAAAWHAGDAEAIAAFYADDAMLFPQNQMPIVGKEAIRSDYRTVLNQFSVKGSSEVAELEVAGDWAFMRGTYSITVTPKAGGQPSEEDHGNWLWIVNRQRNGSWKIFRAIGASEPPRSGD